MPVQPLNPSPSVGTKRVREENGSGPVKQRRTALACRSCRGRKTRVHPVSSPSLIPCLLIAGQCYGLRPVRSSCIELGVACVYEEAGTPSPQQQQQPDPKLPNHVDERLQRIEASLEILLHNVHSPVPVGNNSVRDLRMPGRAHTGEQNLASLEHPMRPDNEAGNDSIDGMVLIADLEQAESRYFGKDIRMTTSQETPAYIFHHRAFIEYCVVTRDTNSNSILCARGYCRQECDG
jgi:hypothetical protein